MIQRSSKLKKISLYGVFGGVTLVGTALIVGFVNMLNVYSLVNNDVGKSDLSSKLSIVETIARIVTAVQYAGMVLVLISALSLAFIELKQHRLKNKTDL